MRAIANANLRRSFNSLALPLSSQWSTNTPSTSDASSPSATATTSSHAPVPPAPARTQQLLSQRLSEHVTSRHGSHTDLQYSLAISGNPSRVWGNYVTLLESAGYQRLPVELHQEVLRKCTPHFQKLRMAINKRMAAGNTPLSPHLHENRFLTIIRNIRAAGHTPDLEDYNFILSQFAATGHYRGSHNVYREILQLGHVPSPKTIGLCYQAIAHRFSLPMSEEQRTEVVAETRDFFSKLMADVEELKIPLTSSNMDLSLRILKESLDLEALESLLRTSYGIDLSYPDQQPLDVVEQANTDTQFPLPFSTSALNTTIDILGRLGNISKMVQTFEVLTQPLPQAFSSFDEDEDDIGAIVNPKSSWTPPSAAPNTTTYSILLRHLCKANHPTLARHYILESIWLANKLSQDLRVQLQRRPTRIHLDAIQPPHVALSKSVIMPVLGYANRRKNLSLMKWLCRKLPKAVKRKGEEVEFLTDAQERLRRYREKVEVRRRAKGPPQTLIAEEATVGPLDVDVSSLAPPSPPRCKPFNLATHLRITDQDYRELRSLAEYIDDLVGRTEQRVKERMGRRVWAGKNLYAVGEGKRKVLTREEWKSTVKFPPRRGTLVGRSTKWANSDYFSQNRRGFSTSFAGLGRP